MLNFLKRKPKPDPAPSTNQQSHVYSRIDPSVSSKIKTKFGTGTIIDFFNIRSHADNKEYITCLVDLLTDPFHIYAIKFDQITGMNQLIVHTKNNLIQIKKLKNIMKKLIDVEDDEIERRLNEDKDFIKVRDWVIELKYPTIDPMNKKINSLTILYNQILNDIISNDQVGYSRIAYVAGAMFPSDKYVYRVSYEDGVLSDVLSDFPSFYKDIDGKDTSLILDTDLVGGRKSAWQYDDKVYHHKNTLPPSVDSNITNGGSRRRSKASRSRHARKSIRKRRRRTRKY
jgi:hypothetical protein